LQALVALARAGVGGPLRTGYLQRRLALETQGEVLIDDHPYSAGDAWIELPRRIGLIEMRSRIQSWRAREGLALDLPDVASLDTSNTGPFAAIGRGDDDVAHGWRSGFASATVLPFRIPPALPPVQR